MAYRLKWQSIQATFFRRLQLGPKILHWRPTVMLTASATFALSVINLWLNTRIYWSSVKNCRFC